MERRNFIKSAASLSAITILRPETIFGSRGNSAIRIGFIGCGNRGTSVISAMSKNTNIQIIGMADLFDDQLQMAKVTVDQLNAAKGFPGIAKSNIYQGSKAYLELINNKDVDAVLISSPCYTHPEFLEAAVVAGKHAYCEKPAAIDVEGCRRIELAGENLNGKLSVVFAFGIRYATLYIEMIKRIHRGDIGDIVSADLYYFSSAVPLKSYKNIPYDEARIRNHFHFLELSGGILLDQGIHMLDVCNWALKEHPIVAMGTGEVKEGPDFGNAWNNYQVVYKYPNNVNMSIHSTQVGKQFGDVCASFIGTKGIAEAHYNRGVFINGENKWDSDVVKGEATPEQVASGAFLSSLYDATENKVQSFIKIIETRNYLNETHSGSEATLTVILGRNAA